MYVYKYVYILFIIPCRSIVYPAASLRHSLTSPPPSCPLQTCKALLSPRPSDRSGPLAVEYQCMHSRGRGLHPLHLMRAFLDLNLLAMQSNAVHQLCESRTGAACGWGRREKAGGSSRRLVGAMALAWRRVGPREFGQSAGR